MIFKETILKGGWLIDPERHEDERGFFARIYCREEFERYGLDPHIAQSNTSFNHTKGTLRGMHYQAPPDEEAKLVRCTQGAIYDVIVDLRTESPTCLQWTAVELTAGNRSMLFIPAGMAHGFLTLAPNTEVAYQMSSAQSPDAARGCRWDDPAFDISWPAPPTVISERDESYPDYQI